MLDGATLAGIYLGEIKKWNDARIKKLNPKLALPRPRLRPVYRSDGSGTNFLFTDYLSKQSPKFKDSDRCCHLGAVAERASARKATRAWPT